MFSVLLLVALVAVGVVYWRTQNLVKNTVQSLKYALTKDFHDPESARFRSVQLQSIEGTVWERIRAINLELLRKSTSDEIASLFTYNPEMLQLCGEVNAKNAFGAYVGYKAFYIAGGDKPVPFVDSKSDFAKKMCAISSTSIVFSEP